MMKIRNDDNGVLDEVVVPIAGAVVHVERLGDRLWWISVGDQHARDRVSIRVVADHLTIERDEGKPYARASWHVTLRDRLADLRSDISDHRPRPIWRLRQWLGVDNA